MSLLTLARRRGRDQRPHVYDPEFKNPGFELTSDRIIHESRRVYRGTNEILDMYGFPDDSQRNKLLSKFTGQPHDAGRFVREAYRIALFFGMVGTYEQTPESHRKFLTRVMEYLTVNIIREGDPIGILSGDDPVFLVPITISRKKAIIPSTDLESVVRSIGRDDLESMKGNELILAAGYKVDTSKGTPIYTRR